MAIFSVFATGQSSIYQHGTVIRMRMGDCMNQHRVMSALSGRAPQPTGEVCPEYTLVSDKVVYLIVGKSSNQLIPLAEFIDFRFHKSELAVRVDDARQECRFVIKEMALRSDWETHPQVQAAMDGRARHYAEPVIVPGDVQ